MKTRKDVIEYCLDNYANCYEDYPFGDGEWAAMRHKNNKKTFVFIYERNGFVALNLKCDPLKADFFRNIFSSVTPAYHMNKRHWNTVYLDGTTPDDVILEMINDSFMLTSSKQKK